MMVSAQQVVLNTSGKNVSIQKHSSRVKVSLPGSECDNYLLQHFRKFHEFQARRSYAIHLHSDG